MVTLCILIIIGALAYSYYEKNIKKPEQKEEQAPTTGNTGKSSAAKTTTTAKPDAAKATWTRKTETGAARTTATKSTAGVTTATSAGGFPYPAKNPGGCRFPATSDTTNFQEYGEEPVTMHESEFKEWWFFCEDPAYPCWSYVGTDKEQRRCILQRRYRHGDEKHPTFEKRFFVIKRNIMASVFALALIEGKMDRNDYKEQKERLDRLFPPANNAEKDGPPVLLPPQELLEQPSEEEIAEAKREEERQQTHNQVVWQDEARKLWFDGDTLRLRYNGKDYTFSGHGYEPMAIILDHDGAAAYIHNSFIVEEECREFVKNPKYLCCTITGHKHNAKHFCMLLTTALDYGYDWQINDLESKMFSLERFAQREIFYKTDSIEFGIYGYEIDDEYDPEEDDEPKTHFEYDVMYIIVDGREYRLDDANMKKAGQLGIFEKDALKPKIRITGTGGSVIAAYTGDWRSGKDFTPFGRKCNTRMFCDMMAYAIRTGKSEYRMEQLERTAAGEPSAPPAGETVYEDEEAKLWLENNSARLKYKDKTYSFGYDGREPFSTISGSNIYVIIRQGENVDAACRYFLKNPEGTIETITGRKLDAKHFCRLLCTAVAHDHGQDSDMEYYMDDLERKAFELEDYQARRKKMEEESQRKDDTVHLTYSRESVCMGDDYLNRSLHIDWADYATLGDLIEHLCSYNDEKGYAAIPYTGGSTYWYITGTGTDGEEKTLAEVKDSGEIVSFCGNDPHTTLRDLGITKLHGKR